MTFFESLLVLLLTAIVLLQVSRRLSLPYPTMMAVAGVAVAFIPRSPAIFFDPDTALALFIAPAVAYAAFDFSPRTVRRFWKPLVSLAFLAVVITTALVSWIGWKFMGLPVAAAVALGAIVAPPDTAAAAAVLSSISIPRSTNAVLKGESLFNDATALLLFSAALAVLSQGALTLGVGLRIAFAIPGGLLLGLGCAFLFRRLSRFVRNTLGGNLLQFVMALLIWIVAEHWRVSAVLCTIAFAMTMGQNAKVKSTTRMRVHSYAVWNAVVFSLNVFAFLLMGLQSRTIIARMPPAHLKQSFAFAVLVIVAVVAARLMVALSLSRLNTWWERSHGRQEPATWHQAVFVGWSGMRGFVTLATAFALPASFPQRDLVVLVAFSVVFATLVLQGLTLTTLVRLLKLNQADVAKRELADARIRLAAVALTALAGQTGPEVEHLRYSYLIQRDTPTNRNGVHPFQKRREVGLTAILTEREELERLQKEDLVGVDTYLLLQEELDWSELTLLSDEERRMEEN
jgi:monovalent cation/hydrogen antiporter